MTPLPPGLCVFHDPDTPAPEGIDSVEALAALWLRDHVQERSIDDLPWSALCVFELDGHPELLWRFCLRAIATAQTRDQIGMLAAGPLEDLIANNGADFIDRIEDEARRSPRFRYTLTGVWAQGQSAGAVWQRVEAACASAMHRGLNSSTSPPEI